MKKTLLPALAVLLLLGTAIPCDGTPAQLRVGTYNIRVSSADTATTNAWRYRRKDVANLVRKLDLDVVGFQEVRSNQLDFLHKAFPKYAVSGYWQNGAGQKVATSNPVFFRKERFDLLKEGVFWLSETPDVPNSKSWNTKNIRCCVWVVLADTAAGTTQCFANVHTDHISALAREKGMELLLNRLDEIAPKGAAVILVGDHNCRENTKPAKLAASKMQNAFYATKTPPKGPWRTFTGWRWVEHETPATEAMKVDVAIRNATKATPEGERREDGIPVFLKYGARIDYIYVSEGVKVLDCETHADVRSDGHFYPSDHFPVTAVIEF